MRAAKDKNQGGQYIDIYHLCIDTATCVPLYTAVPVSGHTQTQAIICRDLNIEAGEVREANHGAVGKLDCGLKQGRRWQTHLW